MTAETTFAGTLLVSVVGSDASTVVSIAGQMDILEETEPQVVATISAAYLKRVLA